MTTATFTETPAQQLSRIQSGFSKNDFLAIMAFANAGVPVEEITPRVNILTFKAWKALGRRVAKGASSVRVTVWIPSSKVDKDGKAKVFPKTCCLFHESQTVDIDADKGARPAAWNNPQLVKEGTYEEAFQLV